MCGLLLLSCCTVVVLDTFGHSSLLGYSGYSTANGAICGAAGERGVAVSNIESKTWPSKSNIPIAFTRKMLSDGLLFLCVTQAVAEQAGPSAEGAFTRVEYIVVSSRLVDVDCHRVTIVFFKRRIAALAYLGAEGMHRAEALARICNAANPKNDMNRRVVLEGVLPAVPPLPKTEGFQDLGLLE